MVFLVLYRREERRGQRVSESVDCEGKSKVMANTWQAMRGIDGGFQRSSEALPFLVGKLIEQCG